MQYTDLALHMTKQKIADILAPLPLFQQAQLIADIARDLRAYGEVHTAPTASEQNPRCPCPPCVSRVPHGLTFCRHHSALLPLELQNKLYVAQKRRDNLEELIYEANEFLLREIYQQDPQQKPTEEIG